MARPPEHDQTRETSKYWLALFYGLLIIAAGAAVWLVVYYAL